MDTERLGIELGDLICETCDESIEEIDDIISTLGRMNHCLFRVHSISAVDCNEGNFNCSTREIVSACGECRIFCDL